MIVRLTPAAQADVETILDWYNGRGQGLRDQFQQAFDRSLQSIQDNPNACAKIHGEIRRALLRQFPYCVFYVLESNEVSFSPVSTGTVTLHCGRTDETHNICLNPAEGGTAPAAGHACVRRSKRAVMTNTTSVGNRLVPALLVRDMAETLEFYRRLGFRLTGCRPDKSTPTWAEVKRDSVTLQFHTDPPGGTPTTPACSGTFYLYPTSVSDLAKELRGKIEFAWGPEVMDYGMREFGVQDPNGYYLAFTEPT